MLGLFRYGLTPFGSECYYAPDEIATSRLLVTAYTSKVEISHKSSTGVISVNAGVPRVFITKTVPTTDQYLQVFSANERHPIYKVELLRYDETPYADITDYVMHDSGSVTTEYSEGVRRTCSFDLRNTDNKFKDIIRNISIGNKMRISLGEDVNGAVKMFKEGVFFFDNPSVYDTQSDKRITISGTDKWAGLNGEHGGTIEGTYIIYANSPFGEMIRKTLRLDIVNDPVPPNIHPSLENQLITYDISKDAGSTIADLLLDAALNINAVVYYDESGRFTAMPIEDERYNATAHVFDNEDFSYVSGNKTYSLDEVYNTVLIIADNSQTDESPIVVQVTNEDPADPNSIANCGIKRVYKVDNYLEGITNYTRAYERARYELRLIKNKHSSIKAECLSLPHVKEGEIIQVYRSYLDSDGDRYYITSMEQNIGYDISSTMTIASVRDK